jgi:hypothetical protein
MQASELERLVSADGTWRNMVISNQAALSSSFSDGEYFISFSFLTFGLYAAVQLLRRIAVAFI